MLNWNRHTIRKALRSGISPPGQTSIFMAYKGDRVTARKTQVETLEGSRFSCHQEHFDLFGRLIQVRENFLAAGGNCLNIAGTLTSYDYDEKDRLAGVCQNDSGSSCGQIRAFTYGGRGVLTAEVQPRSARADRQPSAELRRRCLHRPRGGRSRPMTRE